MPSQERIVFLFLQTIGGARAFFVSRGHVTGDRLTQSFGFGAFQRNNFLGHFLLFHFRRRDFLFFGLATIFLGQTKQ